LIVNFPGLVIHRSMALFETFGKTIHVNRLSALFFKIKSNTNSSIITASTKYIQLLSQSPS
jgi:hypothetical protein